MPRHKQKVPPVQIVSLAKPSTHKPKTRDGVYKVCSVCGREQPVTNFYTNKLFRAHLLHDKWCKSCIREKCHDEKTFREYLFDNNRAWNPDMWQEAIKTATRDLNLSIEFTQLTDPKEQELAIQKRAVECACAIMNKAAYYKYVDNSASKIDISKHIEVEKQAERDSQDPYYNTLVYSAKWRGNYTQFEIDSMDNYLEKIVQARGVEDEIGMDYAKKFVAQSALVDRLAAIMRTNPTKENIEAHKGASAALEVISKAAEIAPAYKKADISVGLGSLGEFIKMMENGQMMGSCPEFPPDQIDGIIKDFKHTVSAVEGAGGLWSA
jgi:hypothetical protein